MLDHRWKDIAFSSQPLKSATLQNSSMYSVNEAVVPSYVGAGTSRALGLGPWRGMEALPRAEIASSSAGVSWVAIASEGPFLDPLLAFDACLLTGLGEGELCELLLLLPLAAAPPVAAGVGVL